MEEDLHLVWFPSTVKREIYVSLFFFLSCWEGLFPFYIFGEKEDEYQTPRVWSSPTNSKKKKVPAD